MNKIIRTIKFIIKNSIASRGIGPRRPDQSPKGKGRVNSLTRRQLYQRLVFNN